jgi:hypothetical protein
MTGVDTSLSDSNNAEAQAEAKKILNSQDPLLGVKKHLDNIIAGEDENKKTVFVLLLSGKKWVPAYLKAMIIISGEPAAGKTTLMEIAKIFHTKEVGRFSKHALDYSDLENYEVLMIKELGVMDKEDYGVSTLKFLSTDDQGYSAEVVEKGESGGWKTARYNIPAITVITSTTRVDLDSQLERRGWLVNPDETSSQTKKIRELKARVEKERMLVAAEKMKITSKDRSLLVLKALVNSLEQIDVIVPFPKALMEFLGEDHLRVRGDYDKIISVCKLYGFLKQRTLLKVKVGDKTLGVLMPDDAIEILQIAEKSLVTMESGLEARTRKLIPALKAHGLTNVGDVIWKDQREALATSLGRSEQTIRKYLHQWATRGYVASDGKIPATYTLLLPLEEIERRTSAVMLQKEDEAALKQKMADEAKEFLGELGDIEMSFSNYQP